MVALGGDINKLFNHRVEVGLAVAKIDFSLISRLLPQHAHGVHCVSGVDQRHVLKVRVRTIGEAHQDVGEGVVLLRIVTR